MTPDEFYEKPAWVRAFVKASEIVASETQEGGNTSG